VRGDDLVVVGAGLVQCLLDAAARMEAGAAGVAVADVERWVLGHARADLLLVGDVRLDGGGRKDSSRRRAEHAATHENVPRVRFLSEVRYIFTA
jgi:hypothetical protein